MTDPRIYTEADWRVLDSLKVRNLTALKGITEQVNARIVRELVDGVNAGESIPKLTKRLQESVNFGKQRATTMARTEVINACADGARVRYEQYGVKEYQYIAASDSRTCPDCAAFDGKVFKMGDNAHMPPLHPNCRCCIAAVIPKRGAARERSIPPKTKLAPYDGRMDLTTTEKKYLRNYQDLGNPQHNWDVTIPEGEVHVDCYVINTAFRSKTFRDELSAHDRALVNKFSDQMDMAMIKSTVPESHILFKGLTEPSWLLKRKVGDDYDDQAYGSFSLELSKSVKYAEKDRKADEPLVFIFRTIESGEHAIYMGSPEEELLLPRGKKNLITQILNYEPGEFVNDRKAIVYHVEEI